MRIRQYSVATSRIHYPMNISKLAQQLKLTPNELLDLLPQVGFAIGRRAIKVDDSQVNKIIFAVRQFQKIQAVKAREQEIKEIRGKESPADKKNRTVTLGDTIIVKDLAEKLQMPIARIMAEMMRNGIMASLNERLDFETASIISEDLGFTVTKTEAAAETSEMSKKELLEGLLAERSEITPRPPVVVIMGHVDHGKTKLLDAIRKTNIMAGESGGITQHIGAYQTEAVSKGKKRTITFLDTPGHEAFKAMRSRGGQIADLAVLVVAADDGLKPQTLESIAIIQKENLPFIVAINKIDKETADIDKVKKELAEINLQPEEWGGKVICAPISALKGTGIPELLEMILLVADLEELKADASGNAVGTIIESHIDKGEGPVATVLIQAGTLKVNDLLIVGPAAGKVKALKDWTGADVTEATPGMPVKILGLKQLPAVGDILIVEDDRKEYNKRLKNQEKTSVTRRSAVTQRSQDENSDKNIPSVNVLIKADVLGSLEAIEESLVKLSSPEAQVRIIKKGLGFVTEADILTAQATGGIIISFHLKENKKMTAFADERKVPIMYEDVIYHVIEKIQKRLDLIKKPTVTRQLIGKLKVLAIFKTTNKAVICGGKVTEGLVKKGCKVKVLRGDEVMTYGTLTNLQSSKENVAEAAAPSEVGMELACDPIVQVGDIFEFFIEK